MGRLRRGGRVRRGTGNAGEKWTLWLPPTAASFLIDESRRQGRKMSWIVGRAWHASRTTIGSGVLAPLNRHQAPKGRKFSVYVHRRDVEEIMAEASRRGASVDRVIALALSLAGDRLRAMPGDPIQKWKEEEA